MTKLWRQSSREEYWTSGSPTEFLNVPWASGVPLTGRFPLSATIEIDTDHEPDDFFRAPLFVISERIKRILEEFNVFAEYFPLNIVYQGAPYTKREFYFANIIDHVDCFDFAKSVFTYHKKDSSIATGIESLVIDEAKTAGHHLFRIAKVSGVIVCVSDELAASIEAAHVTGVKFLPPAMLHLYPPDA